MEIQAPVPPSTHESAVEKVRGAENGWNSRDPHKVSLVYASDSWYRSYGNENWKFDDSGLMRRRIASIDDLRIQEADRKFHLPLGPPDNHPGLTDLGL
jgi:nuclear transport factor 2 (NTF2) superfamily protein